MRILLFAAACLTLSAADITGIWIGRMETRNGDFLDVSFSFTQSGTQLRGKQYGDLRSNPIVEGIVAGNVITFVVAGQEQAGNQINQTRVRYTGNWKDGELELVRERESQVNAGNSGDAQTRTGLGPKQKVRLKRLV